MLHVRNNYLILRIQTTHHTANEIGPYDQSSDQFYRLDTVCGLCHRVLHRFYRKFLGNVWVSVLSAGLPRLHDSLLSKRSMNALILGLAAALCWGFHDICVRFLSQKTPISACIFVVVLTGLVFHTALMTITGEFQTLPIRAVWLSIGAGVFFVIGTYGLYYAFQRGPVRLVAPLIAGFPVISIGIATLQGTPIGAYQWFAVIAIVVGVAVVAALSDTADDDSPAQGPTILLSIMGAIGYAGTFAFGQAAADISHEMPSTLVTRIIAMTIIIGIIAACRHPFWPGKRPLPWLIAMGVADGIALLCVLSAGNLPNPQYAAVTASMFGLLTILLAWVFLKEQMTRPQWAGCVLAFCGVGYLAL